MIIWFDILMCNIAASCNKVNLVCILKNTVCIKADSGQQNYKTNEDTFGTNHDRQNKLGFLAAVFQKKKSDLDMSCPKTS